MLTSPGLTLSPPPVSAAIEAEWCGDAATSQRLFWGAKFGHNDIDRNPCSLNVSRKFELPLHGFSSDSVPRSK